MKSTSIQVCCHFIPQCLLLASLSVLLAIFLGCLSIIFFILHAKLISFMHVNFNSYDSTTVVIFISDLDCDVDVVGGKFNNTHFLTGDGGFMQALINGYAGLKLSSINSLVISNLTVPGDVDSMSLVSIPFQDFAFSLSFNTSAFALSLSLAPPASNVCITSSQQVSTVVPLFPGVLQLSMSQFQFPASLSHC